jgi:hypothetical protein
MSGDSSSASPFATSAASAEVATRDATMGTKAKRCDVMVNRTYADDRNPPFCDFGEDRFRAGAWARQRRRQV